MVDCNKRALPGPGYKLLLQPVQPVQCADEPGTRRANNATQISRVPPQLQPKLPQRFLLRISTCFASSHLWHDSAEFLMHFEFCENSLLDKYLCARSKPRRLPFHHSLFRCREAHGRLILGERLRLRLYAVNRQTRDTKKVAEECDKKILLDRG